MIARTTEEARELARRWAAWHAYSETPRDVRPETGPTHTLGPRERERLFTWVRKRMDAEVERRAALLSSARAESLRLFGGPDEWEHGSARLRMVQYHQPKFDGLPVSDREALSHAVGADLGLLDDPHGEHGLAWDLCKAATGGKWCDG